MSLRIASLGSGSRGNGTLVSDGQTHILIDCGFSMREAQRRMERLGLCLSALSAILVTHEHSDHLKGVAIIARKHLVPLYMTRGTFFSRNLGFIPDLRLIDGYQNFSVGSIQVRPVPVPHDAREPAQFVFRYQHWVVGLLTDLGSVTPQVLQAYHGCHALLLEANHDLQLLQSGPYPTFLKARVGGAYGHLNNQQAAALLEALDTGVLQHLVLAHISLQNNSVQHVAEALCRVPKPLGQVHYACQEQGLDWLILE